MPKFKNRKAALQFCLTFTIEGLCEKRDRMRFRDRELHEFSDIQSVNEQIQELVAINNSKSII